jgi:hypothetical protein
MGRRPLWRCPRCGRHFANRSQWHACGDWTVDEHFADKPPHLRELFDAFLAMVEKNGPVRVHPAKTRIAFIARMSFAGATPLRDRLRAALLLPRRVEIPRFVKIETFGPRSYGHHFYIASPEDLDAELDSLVAEAYRVGMQEFLPRAGTLPGVEDS